MERARPAVDEALRRYREGVGPGGVEYGPECERVTFRGCEALAPDPCAEALDRLGVAVRVREAAGGFRGDLGLGAERTPAYRAPDRG